MPPLPLENFGKFRSPESNFDTFLFPNFIVHVLWTTDDKNRLFDVDIKLKDLSMKLTSFKYRNSC